MKNSTSRSMCRFSFPLHLLDDKIGNRIFYEEIQDIFCYPLKRFFFFLFFIFYFLFFIFYFLFFIFYFLFFIFIFYFYFFFIIFLFNLI